MNNRPKIALELTTLDKIFEISGWISVFAIWAFAINNYITLPDIIPIHYDGAGHASGFGGKGHILTLPLIATALFVVLTILNKFPQIFNYPVTITPDNAIRQYTYATRLIRYLKFIIVVIFGLIIFYTSRTVNGQTIGSGVWFLPLILALIFIPLIYFVLKSYKTVK
jgi:uncharacterized membrane protein